MAPKRKTPEIGLLLYPDVQLAAVYGLTDLFGIAARLASAPLRVSHWQLAPKSGKAPHRTYDSGPAAEKGQPQVVIIPPSLAAPQTRAATAPLARWLTAQHAAGSTLCSVCSGAFVLAETGLLDGRVATTHWTYNNAFAARFPDIAVDTDRLLVDDGDLVTAGGLMAWTDLGLLVVERLLGPAVMLETARYLLLDPPGRAQSYYKSFAPILTHGDEAVLKTQTWLGALRKLDAGVAAMAAKAGLEERTFLRRFRKATGLKPTEYCQRLRVERARRLLEATQRSVDEVAWAVGYEDAGAFRKVFRKLTGLTPGDYRGRFRV